MLLFSLRNLKIFFRQKSAVFFSLLGVFVIIGLYALFLGDVWKENMKELPQIEVLMNSWIIAGIIAVTSITTTMGAFGIFVEDKMQKNTKDFFSAPIPRSRLVGGYIISAYTVGVLLSLFAFLLGEGYLLLSGGALLSLSSAFQLFGVILLSVLASSSMVFFIVSFFNSNSAFSTASSIIGTLIGFLTGIYLPIGTLPEAVQWVIKLFPVSHAAALTRQILMQQPIQNSFNDVPQAFLTEFEEMMGVTYQYGTWTATPLVHIVVLLATALLFFFLALWNVSRKKLNG